MDKESYTSRMFDQLFEICKRSAEKNIISSSAGPLITAGSHQFKTLWTRDFCYSVPGLLGIGQNDLVENQLNIILANRRAEDCLIPRGIDVYPPQLRVVLQTLFRAFPGRGNWLSYQNRKLHPEYLGENGTIAFDSNLLTLLASAQYGKTNRVWFDDKVAVFKDIFSMYDNYWEGAFLSQPGFSDWQDSAERKGITLYSQLLYLKVIKAFASLNFPLKEDRFVKELLVQIYQNFFDAESGLFKNRPDRKQFSLETQLWLIEDNLLGDFVNTTALYEKLRHHPLWSCASIPGIPIFPRYPSAEISWTCKLVGLRGYHDSFIWSWLVGETAKIARKMNDTETYQNVLKKMENQARHDQWIYEIYRPTKDGGFCVHRNPVYESESPFTWGAAKILESLI